MVDNNQEKTAEDIFIDILKDVYKVSVENIAEIKSLQFSEIFNKLNNKYTDDYLKSLPTQEADDLIYNMNWYKNSAKSLAVLNIIMTSATLIEAALDNGDKLAKETAKFGVSIAIFVAWPAITSFSAFVGLSATIYYVNKFIERNWDVIRDSGAVNFVANGIEVIFEKVSEGIDAYKITTALDKFYEEVDSDFDYSTGTIDIITKSSDGFYLKITDGVKNYIFDDDYNSSITGSAIDDIVYLGNGRNVINSGAGNDTIYGGDGVDVVHGGADDDRIITGKGNDIIFGGTGVNYIEPGEGNNEIYCDPNGEDHIYISNVLEIKNTYLEKRL